MIVVYCLIYLTLGAVVALIICRDQMKKVGKVGCEMYMAMEDLDDPNQVADYIEKTIGNRLGKVIVPFCDIDMRIEPVMMQLIVRARLSTVIPESRSNIYEMLTKQRAELYRGTKVGITEFVAGNPGAARFVSEAYHKNALRAEDGFMKMLTIGVVGDKLYMLWNDCCGCDTVLAMAVMNELPEEEILRHINYEQGRGIPFTDEEKEKLRYE